MGHYWPGFTQAGTNPVKVNHLMGCRYSPVNSDECLTTCGRVSNPEATIWPLTGASKDNRGGSRTGEDGEFRTELLAGDGQSGGKYPISSHRSGCVIANVNSFVNPRLIYRSLIRTVLYGPEKCSAPPSQCGHRWGCRRGYGTPRGAGCHGIRRIIGCGGRLFRWTVIRRSGWVIRSVARLGVGASIRIPSSGRTGWPSPSRHRQPDPQFCIYVHGDSERSLW